MDYRRSDPRPGATERLLRRDPQPAHTKAASRSAHRAHLIFTLTHDDHRRPCLMIRRGNIAHIISTVTHKSLGTPCLMLRRGTFTGRRRGYTTSRIMVCTDCDKRPNPNPDVVIDLCTLCHFCHRNYQVSSENHMPPSLDYHM